ISVESVDGANVLNWKSVVTPAGDKAITIKGRYYFGMGMRFAKEMNSTVKFSNSTGVHDGAIVRGDERLKDCQWINAKGFVAGAPISVTIEDQPGNTRPMTGYSMGDGWKAFAYMGATMRVHETPILLEPGKSITAAYKVIVKDIE
ncbi:MAG: PmoA family protein, partial [Thermoguttaceae bacterium]|nr:PmoA family protein [Thermoguttaceae bacterium]